MKDCKANLADWLKGAQRLDALGAKLRAVGMRLSYHNHTFEFEKFPGDPRRKIDILLESTRPENLKAEFDTGLGLRRRRRSGGLHPQVQGPLPGDPRQGHPPTKKGGRFSSSRWAKARWIGKTSLRPDARRASNGTSTNRTPEKARLSTTPAPVTSSL